MEIYLVQHGEPKSEAEDSQRPLTDNGKRVVESVAGYVAAMGLEISGIIHSGKLRAKQTAELFAQHFLPSQGIKEESGLGPLDDPHQAKELVKQAERPLMIVGHLPHLGRLASLLILGTLEKEVIRFRMGGVVCLTKWDDNWSIKWALTPELIQK